MKKEKVVIQGVSHSMLQTISNNFLKLVAFIRFYKVGTVEKVETDKSKEDFAYINWYALFIGCTFGVWKKIKI